MAFAQNAFNEFDETSTQIVNHDAWDDFLSQYVLQTQDRRTVVDYAAVTDADHAALKSYIKLLQKEDPTTLTKDEAFAFWANLYNALTVDIVLERYPVQSIMRIRSGIRPGPWKRKVAKLKGYSLTLDQIEHDILRKFWADNRVHYALNCASESCPNLAPHAFRGDTLDSALNTAAEQYVNHPRGVTIKNGRIVASSIYKWYEEDFGGNEEGVLEHLKKYAAPELRDKLNNASRISRYAYDWDLNDRAP